jgi:hypothetical protein
LASTLSLSFGLNGEKSIFSMKPPQPDLMLSAMTIADLAKKMHCGKCGNRDVAYKAWRQEDAPGFAKRY